MDYINYFSNWWQGKPTESLTEDNVEAQLKFAHEHPEDEITNRIYTQAIELFVEAGKIGQANTELRRWTKASEHREALEPILKEHGYQLNPGGFFIIKSPSEAVVVTPTWQPPGGLTLFTAPVRELSDLEKAKLMLERAGSTELATGEDDLDALAMRYIEAIRFFRLSGDAEGAQEAYQKGHDRGIFKNPDLAREAEQARDRAADKPSKKADESAKAVEDEAPRRLHRRRSSAAPPPSE